MSRTSVVDIELHSTERNGPSTHNPSAVLPVHDAEHDTLGNEGAEIRQLKPVDGGRAAWTVLMAAFIFEALLWGFPISFGVFQDYYSALPQYSGKEAQIALIGTISQGSFYVLSPISAVMTRRFPKYQRQQIWLGLPVCIFSLVLGSFTTTLPGLILTQGFMYGLGFVTLTYPIISMLDEWWVARKGMAFGLISCSSGLSGAVMPFVVSSLLERFGYQISLRAVAVAMAVLTVPLLPVLKARLPPAERSVMAKTNWTFLKSPLFAVYAMSTLVQGLGFFFPALYLPSFARAVGLNATTGALLLAIMAISQVGGQFAFGWVSDKKVHVSLLVSVCSVAATIAVLAIWGLARSEGLLILFAVIYGFFAYAFGTMRVAMGRAVTDDPTSAVATYSVLVFIQGIGNVLAGPLSSAFIKADVMVGVYGIERYKTLTLFIGACMFLSAAVVLGGGIVGLKGDRR